MVDWSVVFAGLSTLALVGALAFAGLQVRAANRARAEFAAITIIQTAQSEGWTLALQVLVRIPENATAAQIDKLGPEVTRAIIEIGIRVETIGYMVSRGIVSLEMVDDLFGGLLVFWWSRIRPFIDRDRERTANPNVCEYFQWLADRLVERRAKGAALPAYQRQPG
jgi:hypothetical protein